MSRRLHLEHLEGRDTPSSFDPAASAVSFTTPDPYDGVPFTAIEVTNQTGAIVWVNHQGFTSSTTELAQTSLWGAPAVVIDGTV